MTYKISQIPVTATSPVSSAALLELEDAGTSKQVSLLNLLDDQTIDDLTLTNLTVGSFAAAYQIPAGTDVVEGLITSGLFQEGENWPLDLGSGSFNCGSATFGGKVFISGGTVGTPAIAIGQASTGFYQTPGSAIGITFNTLQFAFDPTGTNYQFWLRNNSVIVWATAAGLGNNIDLGLSRLSAGLLGVGTGLGGTFDGSLKMQNLFLQGTVSSYKGVNTAGSGVPAIYGDGNTVGATGAISSNSTYTVGAVDGTFLIACNILVTTASLHSFSVEVAYTSEDGTARVLTLSFTLLAGGSLGTLVVNTNGTVPYEYVPVCIRAKAGTTITVRTNAAGTYTTVVYNMRSSIQQIS